MVPHTDTDSRSPLERPRVFISARSADYEYANSVYRFLTGAGVPTFFSQESLPALGNADYRREIDRALDHADHMVVVTSSLDHVTSPWVEAEWGFFVIEQRSGRKRGNLVTILVGPLDPATLPPSLRQNEVIPLTEGALNKLLRYVGDSSRARSYESRRTQLSRFREAATLGGPPRVHLMALRRGESIAATGGFDGAIRLYDIATRTRRAVIGSKRYWNAGAEGLITALEFSRDGRRLASGHFDGSVHAWDLTDEQEIPRVMKHDAAVSGLAFSADGRILTSASNDGTVKSWDLSLQGDVPDNFYRKPASIVSLHYLNERNLLVLGLINLGERGSRRKTSSFTVQIQEMSTGVVTASFQLADRFAFIKPSPDEKLLAAGSGDGSVRVYGLDAAIQEASDRHGEFLSPIGSWRAHSKAIKSIDFLPDGAQLVTAAIDNDVVIWNLPDGKPAIRLQGATDEVFTSVAALEDGKGLVAALLDGRLRVWEAI